MRMRRDIEERLQRWREESVAEMAAEDAAERQEATQMLAAWLEGARSGGEEWWWWGDGRQVIELMRKRRRDAEEEAARAAAEAEAVMTPDNFEVGNPPGSSGDPF